jgi:secreted trypsin-like serine protease
MFQLCVHLIFIAVLLVCSFGEAIVGGEFVESGEKLSRQVLLLQTQSSSADSFAGSKPKPICSAVALSRKMILTAAHCLEQPDQKIYVTQSQEIGLSRTVAQRFFMSQWPEDKNSDMAIGLLDQELPADTILTVVEESNELYSTELRDGEILLAAGFGRTSGRMDAVHDEGRLHKTQVQVLKPLSERKVYSIDQTQGSGICFGDSGGPFFKAAGDNLILVGISQTVVAVPGASDLDYNACAWKAKMTSVDYFKDWIHSTLIQFQNQSQIQSAGERQSSP